MQKETGDIYMYCTDVGLNKKNLITRVSDIELSLMILSQTEYIIALHAHVKYPEQYSTPPNILLPYMRM